MGASRNETRDRDGGCLCGAVRFTARGVGDAAACHCRMCARWTGGPLFSVFVSGIDWHDATHVRTFRSSDLAERSFCAVCGSGVSWRMTHPKLQASMSVPLGVLDDRTDTELTREWFVDQRPAVYALAGERPQVSEAEARAMLERALGR